MTVSWTGFDLDRWLEAECGERVHSFVRITIGPNRDDLLDVFLGAAIPHSGRGSHEDVRLTLERFRVLRGRVRTLKEACRITQLRRQGANLDPSLALRENSFEHARGLGHARITSSSP